MKDRKWWGKARIGKQNDKRVKVSPEDRDRIASLYSSGKYSIREISREYEGVCSRRTIQFIIFPERYIEYLKNNKKNKVHLKYYTTEKRREYSQKYRSHIRQLNGMADPQSALHIS